jgi:hypothetical protein
VEAIVVQVMDHSMDCVLSNMGSTKRVYVNRNDETESLDYLKHDGSLTLTPSTCLGSTSNSSSRLSWSPNKCYLKHDGSLTLSVKWKELGSPQMLQMFSTVQLSLEAHEKSHFEFNARLLKPNVMS